MKNLNTTKVSKISIEQAARLCSSLISDSIEANNESFYSMELLEREISFVRDMMRKRKMTAKQISWFKSICVKNNVQVPEIKLSARKAQQNRSNCQHEDLGSFGYNHGETVKCPHCGSSAIVW